MSNVAVQSSQNYGRGFFRAIKETFWTATTTSISTPPDRPDQEKKTCSAAELGDQDRPEVSKGSVLSSNEEDLTSTTTDSKAGGGKEKKKFKKKKEIVSSSTAVPRVEICTGKKCKAKGSEQLLSSVQDLSAGRVEIAHTTCMSACKIGMNVRFTKDGTTFDMHNKVDAEGCEQILCKHFQW
ncbi:hypothetical protein R1flu_014959 [Riccia fluitans]|uniref:Uncharacterized protein n=1 Tax=Riccia fluitans TaxID=41844 RepID=A0ABD1YHJ8_9MARC